MICNTCMYFHIIRKLHKRVARFKTKLQSVQVRNQVARLLIANGIAFFILYIPFYITRFNESLLVLTHQKYGFKLTATQRGAIFRLVACLVTINSIINPIIYGITNQRYHRAFVQVFSCKGTHNQTPIRAAIAISNAKSTPVSTQSS